jgi:sigma-B regulation protein RsbU (phosphoserine phosphatase)
MRRRILVVDDEPGMQRAVARVLEAGFDVHCAGSSAEALQRAEALAPDLAILDVRMPGLDGFELMRCLKGALPDLDVILMTGSVAETDRKLVAAIRGGAFYFLQKPFDRDVLLTLVERCLELRRLADENRRQVVRLERVLVEARAFQASLLPAPRARIGPLELDARHVPCEALCGDLYDYAACGRAAVAFLVADVSGHGASAAMLTGVVKSSFQSCREEEFAPEAVVQRVAAGIRTFGANRFVTVVCGRLDAEAGRLDYVNAGHPPALSWCGEEEPVRLEPTGPLISPVLAGPWERRTCRVAAGSCLLLCTDGVTETAGPDGWFGLDGLTAAVRRAARGGPALLDQVVRDVERFSQGRPIEDDLTLMTVGWA